MQLDVTDDASVEAALRVVAERHGHLDVLVNSAGISTVVGAEDIVRMATIDKDAPRAPSRRVTAASPGDAEGSERVGSRHESGHDRARDQGREERAGDPARNRHRRGASG